MWSFVLYIHIQSSIFFLYEKDWQARNINSEKMWQKATQKAHSCDQEKKKRLWYFYTSKGCFSNFLFIKRSLVNFVFYYINNVIRVYV